MIEVSMWSNLNKVGVRELNKKPETPRPPSSLGEKNDGTNCQSRTREVSSRYKSPTPRRCPSPNTTRTVTTPIPISNRAISAERRRPRTPQLPSHPSTRVQDTFVDVELEVRKTIGSKLPESLWPSRPHSLFVPFQSDTFSLSSSKTENSAPQALSDRTLKSSSNASQKRSVTPPSSRKATPERKRSPLKGKNAIDQSENSKPLEGLHTRMVDQHRWPGRTGSKVLNKSIDLPHKPMKTSVTPNRSVGASSLRKMYLPDYTSKPLEKSTSDPVRLVSSLADNGRLEYDNLQRMSNLVSAVRSQSLPATGARPPSPKKTSGLASKCVENGPSRTRPLSPASSRGVSPFRIRSSSPSRQSCNSNRVSVLTFVANIKKGKKVADQIEDAHYLRLLYNRQIQWQFVNASAEAALKSQKVTAKKSLFDVWRSTSELRDSLVSKRFDLNQLRLKLKLYSILNQQMAYLHEWASVEREQNLALSGAIEGLQSTTLQLPVTGGATVDIRTMKSSLCSAIQVMQTIRSSIQSSKLEGPNCLISELATIVAQERALLDECEVLLISTASLQAEEYSLRTHLVQLKQAWTPP